MAVIIDFKDIVAWQKAHSLVILVYRFTDDYPKHEIFTLVSQSRRAAVSIPSNIAEGFRRKSKADCLHFYTIALGSLEELRYQVLLGKDLGYISMEQYLQFEALAGEVGRLINAWKKIQK